MYLGEIVEYGSTNKIINNPNHPYTKSLLSSVPKINQINISKRIKLIGEPKSLFESNPNQCVLLDRCQFRATICYQQKPRYNKISDAHFSACHFFNSFYNLIFILKVSVK